MASDCALLLAEINRDGPAPVPISGMLQKRTKVLKAWQGRYFTVRSHFLLYTRVKSFFATYDGGLDLLSPATHISLDRMNKTLTITGINAFHLRDASMVGQTELPELSLRSMVLREAPQFAQLTPKQHAVDPTAPPSLEQWAVALVANIDSLRAAASASAARKAVVTAAADAALTEPSGTTGPARRRSVRLAARAAARRKELYPDGVDSGTSGARVSAASPTAASAGASATPADADATTSHSRAFAADLVYGRYRQCAAEWLRAAGSAALITAHSARAYVAGDANALAANPTWREARLADDVATISKDYDRFHPGSVVDEATRRLFCGEKGAVPRVRVTTDADVRRTSAAGAEAPEQAAAEGGDAAPAKSRRTSFAEADVEARTAEAADATAAKVAEIVAVSRVKAMAMLADVGRSVLCASIYTHLEPGYCQGMHWIAAFCVSCSTSLVEAENLFSTLVQRVLPRDFWARPPAGMNGAIADAQVIRDVLLETQPMLVEKHGEMMVGILSQVVGIRIMVPLFVGDIRVDTTRAIWDELFASCGVAVTQAADAVHAAEAALAEGDAVVFVEGATASGGATEAPAVETEAETKAKADATAAPDAEALAADLPATPRGQRKRRPSLREVHAERQHSRTIVTIAATLALFEHVMPTLIAAEEGAVLMSAAESAIRTVSAAEWRASYRAVLARNPPDELAERRLTVKRKLASNWSQPSALRMLAGAQAQEAELAVLTPGKSSGVGAVVDSGSERSKSRESRESSVRAADDEGGTLSGSAAFALSEIEIGVLQERFTAALADHVGGAYAGGVRRSEFDAVLDTLLGADADDAGETQRGDGWGDALFILMDRDNDGTVDFREMVCALSTLCRGSLEQRLALAFSAFDTDSSGYLEEDEVEQMLVLLEEHAFGAASSAERGRSLELLRLKLKIADTDGDGKLSFDEFYQSCEHDVEMQHAFGCRVPIDLKEHYAAAPLVESDSGGVCCSGPDCVIA